MPHFEELYPGRFLKGVTLDAPKVIRIVSMVGEKLEGDDGAKAKGILKFKDANGDGEIVLCKTNAHLIAKCIGTDDYTKWGGHLVTIHFDPTVRFGAETPGGIRIFGSPELQADKRIEIKRPRRKKVEVYTLRATDKAGRPVSAATATDAAVAP